jgi:hypothetical protein
MAIDEIPEQEVLPLEPSEQSSHTGAFVMIFLLLAALAVGEFYTLSKISSLRGSLEAQQAQARKEISAQLQEQLSSRLSALERLNSQRLGALKDEVDVVAKRKGSTGGELRRARALVTQVQKEQQAQAELLKQEIAQKADQQQLGALSQDVTTQRADLDSTRKALDTLRSDLGMTRTEFGTLIARNHDEIELLRKVGERDYFEFTVDRKHPQRVASVALILKKTNPKRHRFTLTMIADDLQVEKKDRTVNEPIFFYMNGSKKPNELVVNEVRADAIKGYISVPKGGTEVAARSEGAR